METVLIDEKELKIKFVKDAENVNSILCRAIREKEKVANVRGYVGGLAFIPCNEGLDLSVNLKNLLAVFKNNFIESIFFQLDHIRQMESLSVVQSYLMHKGLLEDFLRFKANGREVTISNKRIDI